MPSFTQTASAKAAIQPGVGEIFTREAFELALTSGLEKVWKRDFGDVLKQGMQFVREERTQRETATFQTFRSLGGMVGFNRDADDLPYSNTGDGFSFSLQTYNYRDAIAFEKTLVEVDDVGVTRGRQSELANKSLRTFEYAIADVFNRGVAPSNAPVLADDGMYLIDSSRPNANPAAGTWSNEEATSAITPGSIFTAQLNARASTDENGDLYPQRIRAIIARPQDLKTLWEIRNSNYRPTDAMNVNNYFKEFKDATFDVVGYDYLTSANIFYVLNEPKGDMNELMFFTRVAPEFETWKDGSNPDITRQRVRFAFGIALGCPRKMWRGGVVS